MQLRSIDPQPRSYAQGTLPTDTDRLLFISGQVPESPTGVVAADFEGQAREAWRNILHVLHAAGMTERNLVQVGIYLADRRYREDNARIRHEVLGDHSPALTVIITGIYDEGWLIEIEAVAAE